MWNSFSLNEGNAISNLSPLELEIANRFRGKEFRPYEKVDKPVVSSDRVGRASYIPNILQSRGIIHPATHKYEDSMDIFMSTSMIAHVKALSNYGFPREKHIRVNVAFNLIWYINNSYNTSLPDLLLSKDEVQLLSQMDEQQLQNIMSYIGNYKGALDKASILFALMFGIYIPYFELPPRYYEDVKYYEPDVVWLLANNQYHIREDTKNILPPYVYISFFEPSPVELVLVKINRNNYLSLAKIYGIVFPPTIILSPTKVKYVKKEISRYGPIFERGLNVSSILPDILSNNLEEAKQQLAQYTSEEIVNNYWIHDGWDDFTTLVKRAGNILKDYPQWSLSFNYGCSSNRNKTSREEQQNTRDPIIAYGYHNDYFCYRISELYREWERNIANKSGAKVPFWHSSIGIPETFDRRTLVDLRDLLINSNDPIYNPLFPILDIFINEQHIQGYITDPRPRY